LRQAEAKSDAPIASDGLLKVMDINEKMFLTIELGRMALANDEMPISAMVFFEDEIIAQAYTTESKEKRYLVHAELNALLDADRQGYSIPERKRMQLFTTLEPCLMCYGAAMAFFIGEIYYSLGAPDDGAMRLIKFEKFDSGFLQFQNPVCQSGILVEEAKALFVEHMEIAKEGVFYDFSKAIVEAN
jgi:tRNA(adenine34) deaminase